MRSAFHLEFTYAKSVKTIFYNDLYSAHRSARFAPVRGTGATVPLELSSASDNSPGVARPGASAGLRQAVERAAEATCYLETN